MTSQEIIDLARNQSHVNSTQFPDAQMVIYLNLVKDNFWSYLNSANREGFNWDIFTATTTVVNQSEYQLPVVASDTAWIKKIYSISINYDWEAYDTWVLKYIKAREVDTSNLEHDWNYYVNYQSADDPIYYIADNSYFIAPAPQSAVTNWIQVKWTKKIPDYTISTTEANIIIPVDHHEILAQGILPYIYKAQWKLQESSFEKWEYERQRDTVVRELSDRNLSPIYLTYPDEIGDTTNYTINLT